MAGMDPKKYITPLLRLDSFYSARLLACRFRLRDLVRALIHMAKAVPFDRLVGWTTALSTASSFWRVSGQTPMSAPSISSGDTHHVWKS